MPAGYLVVETTQAQDVFGGALKLIPKKGTEGAVRMQKWSAALEKLGRPSDVLKMAIEHGDDADPEKQDGAGTGEPAPTAAAEGQRQLADQPTDEHAARPALESSAVGAEANATP